MLIRETLSLLKKEFTLEFRQKYAINGILLYAVSAIFICYLSFRQVVMPATWNALFWIIVIFASINAVSRSFVQESRGKLLYLYTLASPQSVIISKTIYNIFITTVLLGCCLFFYSLFIGSNVGDFPFFVFVALIGNAGFASIFTLVSAIASKAGNNFTLMAILSFPVMLPLLIVVVRASKNAVDGLSRSVSDTQVVTILALNVIIWVLSFLLFPYLWKD